VTGAGLLRIDPVPHSPEDLDRLLRQVRFEPRASLQPEVLGRLRRGEGAEGELPSGRLRAFLRAAALVLAAVGAVSAIAILRQRSMTQIVDRCCFDLDGGGRRDDGVQVTADRGGRVRRLVIYEDQAGAGTFQTGDPLRYRRGALPGIILPVAAQLVALRDCCFDLDGEGPADDGFVALVHPPDQVSFAAIYDTRTRPLAVADTLLSPLR
jgi:hypothetical protein